MHDVLRNSVVAAGLVERHRNAWLGLICKVMEMNIRVRKVRKFFEDEVFMLFDTKVNQGAHHRGSSLPSIDKLKHPQRIKCQEGSSYLVLTLIFLWELLLVDQIWRTSMMTLVLISLTPSQLHLH